MAEYKECGRLAFIYRGTKDPEERRKIAEQYADAFREEFDPNDWPAMEDQLPDEDMPQEFFDALGRT
jgi:hypothetical protein